MNEQEIFAAVLEQDADHRAAYLDTVCGTDTELRRRVENLLQFHDQGGAFLEKPAVEIMATVDMPEITETAGTVIGLYKVYEQIGEGGFGIVYKADQQTPVRRRVALKIIKPGMDTKHVLARFKAEFQVLALMDHPNIARVLDAGATETGRPYFVMELVPGAPIIDYCDQNKLPVHERLKLFVQVCHAVQHAHQKGIIHRDIKPSNVLITLHDGRPVPKVIDFGVAKAIDRQLTQETLFTRSAEMIGTPLYMSPEQAEMSGLNIDTRSDIYSLGVLLYELLTGSTPFEKDRLRQATYDEIRRIIREEEPPKPSQRISALGDTPTLVAAHRRADPHRLSQLVRGDLDWIVMKALEKDRTRRYDTASSFAADVLRYLGHQPIEARPPSATYRFGKFARRNRVAFMTAILVLAAILLGTVVSVTQAIRAMRAERLAETRLQTETDARKHAEDVRRAEAAQRQIAENERAEATRLLYVSQIDLAAKNWDGAYARGTRELLESAKPEHTGGVDLRGWEWHYLWRLSHSELRTINFKSLCLAFSPDGQLLVSGDREGTLKMWNSNGTREVRTIKAHRDRIQGVAFSRDGRLLATFSKDDTAKLWETATGREMRTFPGSHGNYRGIALSPDGHQLAIPSHGLPEVTTIWDTSSGKEIRTLKGHTDKVEELAFSPDGKRLASGGKDGTLRLWDATTGRELWLFAGHNLENNRIGTIAFSPDGKTLVSGDEDGVLKCCDVATGREIKTFTARTKDNGGFTCLAFNGDGTRIASASEAAVKLWDPVSGAEIQTLKGHTSDVDALAFSPQGDVIASGSADGTIRFWDAASRQEPWSLRQPGCVSSVVYSGDGKRLAAASDGVIIVRNALTGERLWEAWQGSTTWWANSNLRFDPTSRVLASGLGDGSVRLQDAQDGRVLRSFKAHDDEVTSLDFSPDGRILATSGMDKRVAFWNPLDGRRIATLNRHTDAVVAVAFSPNSKLLAAATNNDGVRVFEVPSGREVRTLEFVPKVRSIAFSRDGRQIFGSGGEANVEYFLIHVWDVETGKFLRVLRGSHTGFLRDLSLSHDARRLASCADRGTLQISDVATGRELLTLHTNTCNLRSVAFSPDETRLAVGTQGGQILIFDARPLTDELRAELNQAYHSGEPLAASTHNGARFAAGSETQKWHTDIGR